MKRFFLGWGDLILGHNAYLGMLTVDVHHTHPVMRAFIELLQSAAEQAHEVDIKAKDVELLGKKWFFFLEIY